MSQSDDSTHSSFEELLHDHEQASEDARYRDRLLYNSYYLATVVFLLLTQSVFTLITNDMSIFLPIIFLSGGFIYSLLTAWAIGVRRSRDNAWERRGNIEDKIQQLHTNSYSSLNKGKYNNDDADGLKDALSYIRNNCRSFSDIPDIFAYINPDLVSWFLIPVTIILFSLGLISITVYLNQSIVVV